MSSFPISAAATREVDLVGSFRYADTYNEAVDLLSKPNLSKTSLTNGCCPNPMNGLSKQSFSEKLAKLVTHRFPLTQTKEAFELLARGKDEQGGVVLKIVIES